MKVLQTNNDGNVTLELSQKELGLLALIAQEYASGEFSPSDEEWRKSVVGAVATRDEVLQLAEMLP